MKALLSFESSLSLSQALKALPQQFGKKCRAKDFIVNFANFKFSEDVPLKLKLKRYLNRKKPYLLLQSSVFILYLANVLQFLTVFACKS
jgi:hypothetical protein